MVRILLFTAIVFLIDQGSKFYVVEVMNLRMKQAIDLWPPYLNFRMAWNQGINFGLFSNDVDLMRWGLISLALVVSAWLLWWGRRFTGVLGPLLIGLVVGGALGNSLDRVIYGAVADFLNMSCCGFNNPYAFNVADIAIFAGAIGLVLFSEKLPKRRDAGENLG